jgi:hypothetical protein
MTIRRIILWIAWSAVASAYLVYVTPMPWTTCHVNPLGDTILLLVRFAGGYVFARVVAKSVSVPAHKAITHTPDQPAAGQ